MLYHKYVYMSVSNVTKIARLQLQRSEIFAWRRADAPDRRVEIL